MGRRARERQQNTEVWSLGAWHVAVGGHRIKSLLSVAMRASDSQTSTPTGCQNS